MLQLSMDGPNVNWKTYRILSTDIERESNHKLFNVGSCGLHQVHNAFKAGSNEADWEIEHTLSFPHWLFKDAPARCEDFKTLTGCTLLPKKFCQLRWIQNVPVMDRALQI